LAKRETECWVAKEGDGWQGRKMGGKIGIWLAKMEMEGWVANG
jgi:hypothetical protein